jgi:hypothetical protein
MPVPLALAELWAVIGNKPVFGEREKRDGLTFDQSHTWFAIEPALSAEVRAHAAFAA